MDVQSSSSPSNLEFPSEIARGVHVIYDGSCPFCANFVRLQRLRKTIGNVNLLNAREHPILVQYFSSVGIPLDDGMALVVDTKIYYGAACINRLALMSSNIGLFNRLSAAIFCSERLSKFLYPVLKLGRRMVLYALGTKPL